MFAATLTACCSRRSAVRAQQPRVIERPAGAPSRPAPASTRPFRRLVAAQAEPGWIGYAVPVVERRRAAVLQRRRTWITRRRRRSRTAGWHGCGLGADHGDRTRQHGRPAGDRLRSGPARRARQVVVLYRVEEKAVQRIRIFSPDCELDAGGRTIQWLDGVNGADSVTLLADVRRARRAKSDRVDRFGAISAIAMHKDERGRRRARAAREREHSRSSCARR